MHVALSADEISVRPDGMPWLPIGALTEEALQTGRTIWGVGIVVEIPAPDPPDLPLIADFRNAAKMIMIVDARGQLWRRTPTQLPSVQRAQPWSRPGTVAARLRPPTFTRIGTLSRPKPFGGMVGMALDRSTRTGIGGSTARRSDGVNSSGHSSNIDSDTIWSVVVPGFGMALWLTAISAVGSRHKWRVLTVSGEAVANSRRKWRRRRRADRVVVRMSGYWMLTRCTVAVSRSCSSLLQDLERRIPWELLPQYVNEVGRPARSFPSYRGQRNFPGWYWSATVGRRIGSNRGSSEITWWPWILIAVVDIVSQTFWLV